MNASTRLLACGLTALLLAGCGGNRDGNAANPPMELKLYATPAGQASTLRNALAEALGSRANVGAPSPDQLLVYAPRSAQASIRSAIGSLTKAASAAPVAVNVRFWVIAGVAGSGSDDPALAPLRSSLDAVRKNLGALHFRLIDTTAAAVAAGARASIRTSQGGTPRDFQFQIAPPHGDTTRLEISYSDDSGTGMDRLGTTVDATFGRYLILAQSPGACATRLPTGIATSATCADTPPLRLLVVRIDRDAARG